MIKIIGCIDIVYLLFRIKCNIIYVFFRKKDYYMVGDGDSVKFF